MINVNRGPKPKSLDRPEIKKYLDELVIYQELSDEERKKAPKPNAGEYRESDVLVAFDRDFHSKCYLTEQKYANSWAMDVEHFKPQAIGQFPELKYEWTNLYPCSHDANILKPKNDPIGGYLDPCSPDDDVEKEIVYVLGVAGESIFDPLKENNLKAKNTAELLEKVHNGNDFNSKQKTASLRLLIAKREREVNDLVHKWQDKRNSLNEEDILRLKRKLKNILSRKSDFTMLLRSLSCVKKYVPDEFLD